MGEVVVRVRLSNAWDEECVRRGVATEDQIRSCDVDAIVDTGCTRSVISRGVAERLGLSLVDNAVGNLADGSTVSASICSSIQFEIMGRRTAEEAYVMGDDVLIGQTTLEATDLLVDCKEQTLRGKHAEGPLFRF